MILGFSPAQILRAYVVAALSLGAAAYVSGLVTADICEAYDSGAVVGEAVPGAPGNALVRSRPMLCA